MKMLLVTYRDSLQEDIQSLLRQAGVHAYTMIPTVHGVGETGAAVGSFLSHGENSLILAALDEESTQRMKDAFRALRASLTQRQHGAVIPMKMMVMPCEEII